MFFRSLFVLATAATLLLSAATQCQNIYYHDTAPDIVNQKMTAKARPLCFSQFAVMHSGISRTPLWSAEHLTREGLRTKTDRTDDFHAEDRLPIDERSELNDFARSGYDRGHLAPSFDMASEQAQHESFSLSNIVPQSS